MHGTWLGVAAVAFIVVALFLGIRGGKRRLANFGVQQMAAGAKAQSELAAQMNQHVTVVAGNTSTGSDPASDAQATLLAMIAAGFGDEPGTTGPPRLDSRILARLLSGVHVSDLEGGVLSHEGRAAVPVLDVRAGGVLVDRSRPAHGVDGLDAGTAVKALPSAFARYEDNQRHQPVQDVDDEYDPAIGDE